ncbi:MAG: B12-binding domain-containing radical SAM protein [Candidatus Muiribacteriota bacterium]
MKKFVFVYSAYENLGIEILSSILKKNGYQTDLIFFPMLFKDSYLNIKAASAFNFEKKIIHNYNWENTAGVFFNVSTVYYRFFLEIARYIKKKNKNIPVVFGGVHPTSCPEIVLENNSVDYVCVGEGDRIIIALAKHLLSKKNTVPPGIWFKKEGRIIKNKTASFPANINLLPFPDKALFYKKAPYFKKEYTILTTRGCYFNCSYCINNFWYKKIYKSCKNIRFRSMELVLKELIYAKKKYNFKKVIFYDDDFYRNSKEFEHFLKNYKKEINRPFICILHPAKLNRKNLLNLKRAGCIHIEVGVQTLNEQVRKKILNRYETNKTIIEGLKNLKEVSIPFNIDHMTGLPEDTVDFTLKAARIYSSFNPERVLYIFLTNYPQLEINKVCIEKKNLTVNDIINIENGYCQSQEEFGSVRNKNLILLKKCGFIFGWLPILPYPVIKLLSRKKILPFLPSSRIITKIIPTVLITLFKTEIKGKMVIRKYLYEIFNRKK